MSDGYLSEKKRLTLEKKSEWLVDSVLVCLYSIFMLGCFFLAIFYKEWGFWYALVLIMLFSFGIGFVHHNLNRTLKVFFLASILAIVLSFIPVAFLFHSTSSRLEINEELYSQERFWALVFFSAIYMLVPSILGGITGYFIAKIRKE